MIKLIFHEDRRDYCKYRQQAMENFNDFISYLKLKDKRYLNGKRKVWLTKTDFKYCKYFIKQLECESVFLDIEK